MTSLINVTAAHPTGCSDPNPSAQQYAVIIQNSVSLSLLFDYVDANCNDNILPAPDSTNPQVITPGSKQTILVHSGSALVALEAINNGLTTGHVVAAYKSGAVNSTWLINADLNPPSGSSTNVGAIAGGTVGGLVALALIGGAFYWFYWRRRGAGPGSKLGAAGSGFLSKLNLRRRRDENSWFGQQPQPSFSDAPSGESYGKQLPSRQQLPQTPQYGIGPSGNSLGRQPTSTQQPNYTQYPSPAGRRPSGGNSGNNSNSLGRPTANNSLGRPQTNNSLGRPLPSIGGSNAPIPPVPVIPSVTSKTKAATSPTQRAAALQLSEDDAEYYTSEPVDPTAPGSRLRLRYAHMPDLDDELRLNKGDIVEMVEAFEDGWCHVKVIMSGARGYTRRGDEGMIPVGSLELSARVAQQKVMNKAVVVDKAKKKEEKGYKGTWDDYTRQRNRESSLHSGSLAGFGDSDGSPTEEGLATDARAAFDWVVSQGVEHSQILLLGHSLGTGVAARLAADLEMEGIRPRGLVLQAAYASIIDAALEYNAFQVLPLLLPLKYIPKLEAYIKTCIIDRFSTMERIEQLRIPVLLMHGRLDREIPCKNSRRLFLAGVAAQQGSATDQVVLAAAANESAFSAAVAGLEDITSVSAEEGVGRRWVASKDKNIGPGPIKIMFVELAYAHHNNVQAFDLTYESMESLFDIDVDGQQRNTGQEASLSNLVE
ncbi:hypothetical protein HDU83_008368 [Entophlyctis luteolus]|nr:hypothetical protein HDU83_008368 [Entophlyctis luteolus]